MPPRRKKSSGTSLNKSSKNKEKSFKSRKTAMNFLDEFSLFVRVFGFLIKDGYVPSKAVEILSNNATKDMKKALLEAVKKVNAGIPLSDSFESTNFFPKEFCNILYMGERSGKLDESLDMYGEYLEKVISLRKHFSSALRYPSFMLGFICVAVLAAVIVVVPKMQQMATSMNVPMEKLPGVAKLLFGFRDTAMLLGTPGLVILALGLAYYFIGGMGIRHITILLGSVPQIKAIFNQLNWAQWLMLGSICLKSGMGLEDTLKNLEQVTLPREIAGKGVYSKILYNVSSGHMLSHEIEKTKTPPLIPSMLGIAEKSGRMSEVMESIAGQYLYRLSFEVKNIGSIVEPIVIAIATLLGGSIAASILFTMFAISSHVQ